MTSFCKIATAEDKKHSLFVPYIIDVGVLSHIKVHYYLSFI